MDYPIVITGCEGYSAGQIIDIPRTGEHLTVVCVEGSTITVQKGYDPEAPVKHAIRSLLDLG